MNTKKEPIDQAFDNLCIKRRYIHEGEPLIIAYLVRSADLRPLNAYWWNGKEVYLIGSDINGNFFLCHCDGTVRHWNHQTQMDQVLAPSVKEFARRIVY